MSNDRGYNDQQQPNYGYGGYSSYNSYNQGPPPPPQQQWQSPPPNQGWQGYSNYPQGPPPPQQYQYYQQPPPPQQYQTYQQGPPPQQQYTTYPAQYNQPGPPPPQQSGQPGDRGLMDHVPFTAQHAQDEAQKHRHPLAALLNKEGTHISFNLVDAGDDLDHLIPTAQADTSFKPAYTVRYRTKKYNGEVSGAAPPDFDQDEQRFIGGWKLHSFHDEKLEFKFPWEKWGFDPDNGRWLSDVKLLGGKSEMEFVVTDQSEEVSGRTNVSFTLRCVDMSDSEKRVVSMVKVRSYRSATIEIPVKIISNKEQLDELIVVTLAVMDRQRDNMVDE